VGTVDESMTDLGKRGYLLVTIAVEVLLCIVDGCEVACTVSEDITCDDIKLLTHATVNAVG
jgi:hypothetical protein